MTIAFGLRRRFGTRCTRWVDVPVFSCCASAPLVCGGCFVFVVVVEACGGGYRATFVSRTKNDLLFMNLYGPVLGVCFLGLNRRSSCIEAVRLRLQQVVELSIVARGCNGLIEPGSACIVLFLRYT